MIGKRNITQNQNCAIAVFRVTDGQRVRVPKIRTGSARNTKTDSVVPIDGIVEATSDAAQIVVGIVPRAAAQSPRL